MKYNAYENVENIQKKKLMIVNQSISKILRPLKTNHILEFLIVLDDFQYIHWCCGKSTYDLIYLEKSKFPGNLKIVHVNELTNQYIIDGPVQTKTLYIKLPKENVYVESTKYQEKQFHSKFNELIAIFSELNAKKVNFYFHNMDESSLQIDSKLRVNPYLSKNVHIHQSNEQTMHIQKKMSIDFDRRKDSHIDINRFTDSSKYYYLPKEFDWIEVIRNRNNGNMKTQKYSFIFSNDYRFRSNFYDSLKKLEIEFGYASYKFNEIHIEYEVDYYSDPMDFEIDYMNPFLSIYQLLEKKKSE